MATRPSPEGKQTRWRVIRSPDGIRTRVRVTDWRGTPDALAAVVIQGNHQLAIGVGLPLIARAGNLKPGEIALVHVRDTRPEKGRQPPDQEDQTGSYLLLYRKDQLPKVT